MDSTTISKAKPPHKSMDYHFLREEGIRHIQNLAGHLWTDYNSHDPGITLLEILCYAITDLGYRTNFPIEDLLADSDDNNPHFYGITEILPSSPVTLSDIRKLIVDHEAIRNAWIEKNTTTYGGLYDITLELEDDDTWGDLNFNLFHATVSHNGTDYDIEVAFPFWDELSDVEENPDISAVSFATAAADNSDIFVFIQNEETTRENANDYYAEVNLTTNTTNFRITVWVKVTSEIDEVTLESDSFQNALKATLIAHQNEDDLVNTYWQKVRATLAKVNTVKALLHSYRPLCEDFRSFRAFQVQEIGIRADIDLSPDARPAEVLAEIYYRIHTAISPRPHFHTLEDLLAKGHAIEDIFEGPLLQHGFIDTKALEAIRQQDAIYTSDLLQRLTDIPGLIAVSDLRMTNYYNNDILTENVPNCLRLASPDRYKPRLSPDKCRISCYKGQLPVTADNYDTLQRFEALKSQARQEKKAAVYTLDPPQGKNRNVSSYFSIQHHVPPVYGVGVDELPPSASETRKAQARQLKGYLLFFEQLLADYFAQLSQLKTLFSMDSVPTQTYFSQSLFQHLPEAAALLNEEHYTQALPDMAEPPGTAVQPGVFHDRRNRFLDHLMARFCESFTDYALLRYAGDEGAETIAQRLINDKANFLQDYPTLSRDRAKGFNYHVQEPHLWDTPNVSGLKKRIARLIGLPDYQRSNGSFHCIEHLLLRPGPGNHPIGLQIPTAGDSGFLTDPYSFRISFILSVAHPELSRPDFRQYTESVIYKETPAHIIPHIYWVDNTQLADFESVYKAWLENAFAPVQRDALVSVLNTFNSAQIPI